MDFTIFAAVIGILLLQIVLTYDIACQWLKNFRKRMEELPPEMRIPDKTKFDVAIPSWHINGHGDKCSVRGTPADPTKTLSAARLLTQPSTFNPAIPTTPRYVPPHRRTRPLPDRPTQ